MSKKDKNTKAFAQAKRHRRQWLAFVRMCRYGVNNFTRNAWLTVAATVVMTITLLIVFVTVAAQNVLSDTVADLAQHIDRSIYLKTGTTEKQASPMISELKGLSNVKSVSFYNTSQSRADYAEQNKTNSATLNAITVATDSFPAKIRVNLKDPNDTGQLVKFVKDNKDLKNYIDPNHAPTFIGSRGSAIDTIAGWTRTARELGIGASILFIAISILIIFNTIRMAIFNRKDEIEMMKLIGADKGFIRGPFVVEAMVYGFIAAIVATVLGFVVMYGINAKIGGSGVIIEPTINLYTTYVGFVLLAMIVLGAVIGTISSLLATRRYLKI